ncbi:thioesterase II family protein [Streptomyces sp. NBC_00259]|uniref:thioesterase II family protein n=1 Tax=Streptomyces sp. NBC_00259 TaxID=2903643 RepID=UPI002E2D9FA5|nr:alpha/beta fold hydrolase [Streptomyces sp. NBC_00259]
MATTSRHRAWLLSGPPRPGAPQLYCFPHAGGNPVEYMRWADLLPPVELHVVQLPGRGPRHHEPDGDDIDSLVAALLAETAFGEPQRPYAFFGHSFGALLAYETTRALRDTGRRLPDELVVSAYPAPHLPHTPTDPDQLSDTELLRAVADRHGGIPPEIIDSRLLRALVARPLRTDLRLVAGYRHRPAPPLPVPTTVLAGTGDRLTARALTAWQDHTLEPLSVRMFPGGHFYLREHEARFLTCLQDLLMPLTRRSPDSRPRGMRSARA